MIDKKYFDQAKLMLQVLPCVAHEDCFALKGGTAINFFLEEMPRLSIDIDLAYLPIEGREDSLNNIGQALERIAETLRPLYKVALHKARELIPEQKEIIFTDKLVITSKAETVTIEANYIFRGFVFPPERRVLVKTAQKKFELSTHITTLSVADLYGGKLCAALDRQHPRDLFDVEMILKKTKKIDSEIRKAFVIYLASQSRPMHELLHPNFKDIRQEYESSFRGMTEADISYKDLVRCQRTLPELLRKDLAENEKGFLVSLKKGEPNWGLMGIDGIDKLPALLWKLQNIRKMDKKKRDKQLQELISVLA